nr:MAG TPA: hypothetical protein [Caudoviricetes sp.]
MIKLLQQTTELLILTKITLKKLKEILEFLQQHKKWLSNTETILLLLTVIL